METNMNLDDIKPAWHTISTMCHAAPRNAGWCTDLITGMPIQPSKVTAEKLCLIHSELSEATETSPEQYRALINLLNLKATIDGLLMESAVVKATICDIHTRLSQAMEGHRKSKMDDKLPHRPMIEVELADAVIRIGDLAGALGLDLGGAMAEKMGFNAVRSDHKVENRVAVGGKAY